MKKYKNWREEQKEVFNEMVRKSPTGHQFIYDKESLKILDRLIPKGKVLDIGCGTAQVEENLKCREWYGVDISPESIKIAKRFCKEAKVGDATKKIPFPDRSFNNVLAMSLLHHTYRCIPEVIKEVKRVIKRGGEFIIIDHNINNTHLKNLVAGPFRLTPTDEKCIDPDEVKKILVDNGFEIKDYRELQLSADQGALKPSFLSRLIKVPILLLLDLVSKSDAKSEFFIKAKLIK